MNVPHSCKMLLTGESLGREEGQKEDCMRELSVFSVQFFWTSETVQLRLKNDHKDRVRIETVCPMLGLDTGNPNCTSVSI